MNRPSLTLSEAAIMCGVSRSTIRRKHEAGAFPSAWKDSEGAWRVPVEDILAAGLKPGRPSPPDDASAASEPPLTATVTIPLNEWDALKARAADAERRATAAQTRVADLDRALTTAELALRAITQGPPPAAEDAASAQQGPFEVVDIRDRNEEAGARRRLWRRRRKPAQR